MELISFESWQQTSRFHNPLKEGQLDVQQIEVRIDPLTGHQSVANSGLAGKAMFLFPDSDPAYLEQRAQATRSQCFLCDDKWRQTTPRYAAELVAEGRLVQGEAVLFPNLFPLSAYHAVVMLGNAHYRTLNDFPAALLEDGLSIALDFIRRCYQADSQAKYFTINANYLFPAGASVIHPHLQILGASFPGTHHRLLLMESERYFRDKGRSYWPDLLATERDRDKRYLGTLCGSEWYTAFSPMGANEVQAVWPHCSHFLEWGKADIQGMAEGLSRVLAAYHDMKLSTFNFSCFSGSLDGADGGFRCMLRMVNRQNAVPHYRTDDFYFQKLLRNEIIVNLPETLAAAMRPYFS